MPRRVLVVDDEAGIVFTLKTILESSGYLVSTASSAQTAKENLASACFDVIITDMRMETDTAGYEVADTAARLYPQPVVIAVTAYAELMTQSRQRGINAIFDKPTPLPKLLQTIEDLLKARDDAHAA